jgi:uncharacterized protein (DUF2267 family)
MAGGAWLVKSSTRSSASAGRATPLARPTSMASRQAARKIGRRSGSSRSRRAVLHSLRDRLTIEETAHLGDQLPMLVRGIYYEAWRPAGKPERIRSREEFLERINERLALKEPIDVANAARAVLRTLEKHVSAGEIRDVMAVLPEDIRALWPPLEEVRGAD